MQVALEASYLRTLKFGTLNAAKIVDHIRVHAGREAYRATMKSMCTLRPSPILGIFQNVLTGLITFLLSK